MLDEASLVAVHAIDGGAVVAAAGEPPLLLVKEALPRVGRWGRDAVVVVFGDNADALAATVLEALGPKLIAVAATEAVVDRAFAAIGGRLDGTGLVALEAGLALEV